MDISNLPKHRDIPSSSTTRPLNRATPNSPLRAIPSNLLRATLHSRHYKVILVKARHILPSNSLPLLTLDILHSRSSLLLAPQGCQVMTSGNKWQK